MEGTRSPAPRSCESPHFTVLREADLVEAEKVGRVITYRLKLPVLEGAMLGFAQVFGLELKQTSKKSPRKRRPTKKDLS